MLMCVINERFKSVIYLYIVRSNHTVDYRLVYVIILSEVCHFVIIYTYIGTTGSRSRLIIRDKMATDKLAVCVELVFNSHRVIRSPVSVAENVVFQ